MNTLKKRILIVEDEALIADHIEQLLLSAEYDVPGIFDEADELFAFLEHQTVDLVLLDINLNGDLDGVDIAHELNNRYNIPFIYLTSNADSRTASRVKMTRPEGFISKPYTPESLLTNIDITLYKLGGTQTTPSEDTSKAYLFVKDKGTLIKVRYSEISHVQAMDNYAIIYTEGGKRHVLPHTLKKIEDQLPTNLFVRCHRSYLVNIEKITRILPKDLQIGEVEIPLSESHRSSILERFNTL